uniref:Ketosynthase family 3 (KS3) domain-containing protein n=1 Tax=Vespula pensylvanica TaxID=30213 RepID=A0A834P8B4_VESPE|nr:hypothetical protein H0235_004409 [Vespula pensylvanica]
MVIKKKECNKMQSALFKQFYDECNVSMTSIPYIEAHGTGTRVGDHEELNAIDHIFTNCRANPLKIGSIKSSIGHIEGASGIYSIANMIILMELGLIPANINFNRPPKNLKAHLEGPIEVVIQQTSLIVDCIDVNSSGFGGANAQVLLKSNPKIKFNKRLPDDDLPRFVTILRRVQLLHMKFQLHIDVKQCTSEEFWIRINDNHIGNSRDTSFEKMILQQTDDASVDIVLNCIAQDKLQVFLCFSTHRLSEIGKVDLTLSSMGLNEKSKNVGCRCFDKMTRKLYADLRHFVVFSSVLCGRENAGQTNYGMANFIMRRIYEKRVKEDLLGLTIQWEVIGDVGFVADMQNKDKELVIDKFIVTGVIVVEKRAESDINNVVDTILTIIGITDLKNVSS